MRIPEIIEELHKLADMFDIPRLHQLADELRRRPGQRGPRVAKPLTPEVIARIKSLARTTDLPQVRIAHIVGVNQGRVSEILKGKRQ